MTNDKSSIYVKSSLIGQIILFSLLIGSAWESKDIKARPRCFMIPDTRDIETYPHQKHIDFILGRTICVNSIYSIE